MHLVTPLTNAAFVRLNLSRVYGDFETDFPRRLSPVKTNKLFVAFQQLKLALRCHDDVVTQERFFKRNTPNNPIQ